MTGRFKPGESHTTSRARLHPEGSGSVRKRISSFGLVLKTAGFKPPAPVPPAGINLVSGRLV